MNSTFNYTLNCGGTNSFFSRSGKAFPNFARADQGTAGPRYFWGHMRVFLLAAASTLLVWQVSGQNAIVEENLLPGSPESEWDISGAGDLSIQGFATDMSYNKGTTAEFKVDVTGPATTFNVKIYRLGYYQGNGARMVIDLGNFNGVDQPACITQPATGLVDCGNWSVSATWAIPANAVSGLYIAKLTRTDNNGASHIAFVVRDDESTADMIFKTSDATWQAYNVYGGNSLYVGTVPGFPSGHAPKVSYNRPFWSRAGGGGGGAEEDWLFNCEYPMIRFLERNGYDLVYTTDIDLDRNPYFFTSGPDPVLKHKVFLSVGHDEYWSGNERANVEAARDAGMHLAFFSGNEIYWRTRWENSIDGTGTPFRTLVCYKEGTLGENTCGGKCDPSPEWTGLWRDGCDFPGSGGCNPENILSGQISWTLSTSALQVPASVKDFRFWRNSPNVSNLTPGDVEIMTSGTLGYEWNQYQPQYASTYPAGRVLLTKTILNGLLHEVSLFRHAGGALVFGAGTVQWMWGLDENHDRGNAPPSPDMQQATINLFADMGVQPATLMQGMVAAVQSTDVTPPVSVITNPAEGATVQANGLVIVAGTAAETEGVVAGVEVSVDGGTTWQTAVGTTNWTFNWIPAQEGPVTILSRAFDDLGNLETPAEGQPNYIEVTVGPPGDLVCPCNIWPAGFDPAGPASPDQSAVELGVKFRSNIDGYIAGIRFYKHSLNTGVHIGNLWTTNELNLASVQFTNESPSGWQVALFPTPVAITANTTYIASYHTTVGRYALDPFYFNNPFVNNPLTALATGTDGPNGVYNYGPAGSFPNQSSQASNYWVDVIFVTEAGPDDTPPVTSITNPSNGATLPVDNQVVISGNSLDIQGQVVSVEVSVDGGTTWEPATGTTNWTYSWTPTTQGTVNILARATDNSQNQEVPTQGQPNYITITIGPPDPFDCPCTIWPSTTIPSVPSNNDAQPVELGVKFRASVDGVITGIRFYKGLANTGIHTGNLWTSSGQNLATALFTNETPSGWQEVIFSNPVPITANTTYVASYHTTSGRYAFTSNYFTSAVVDGPLTALANGTDGPNGVYNYGAASSFPTQTFQASNYWVDVVFLTDAGPDVTPPAVLSVVPPDNTGGVSVNTTIQAVFSEEIDEQTLSASTFSVDDGGGAIAGTISYNPATQTATFTPSAPLAYSTLYTATLTGGAAGITDLAGNALASDFAWSFTTAAPPPPPPNEGPGGPILVISSATNPFSRYPVEILRAQGHNDFMAMDVSLVTPAVLDAHDVVILGEFPLSSSNVTDLTNWVEAGGTLIAFRPDPQLASLLGITPAGGTLSEGYLLVNTASGPGSGIVNETIQFHGAADYYTLSGATALATLYSNATTPTVYPAVTLRNVGANGGKAAAFTYDLARSIVYTRQGNPAWEGQNRDVDGTDGVIRPNDLFFGNAPGDPQPDWVNLDKAAIPQADEQMHLLSNIILQGNLHRKPLPRFWFLPNKFKAAVVMTGDDHGVGLTDQFFDLFTSLSSSNTPEAVANWQAVRGSSYVYTNTPLPDALTYQNQGFEVGIHVNTGCGVWTPASLNNDYTSQLAQFATNFPNIFPPSTHRTHCIAWSDYDTQPQVEAANGIRLDVNYYYWPASWILDRPGLFTGSGLPMRFAQKTGEIIDCYQVNTQLTDESGQNIPLHIATLLDNAVGTNQYYGVFCANMHTDNSSSLTLAQQIISAAQQRSVPVVSSRQMLEWLDGRNGSTFGNMAWNGNDLSFDVSVGSGANNLYGMLPAASASGQLISITLNGSPVAYDQELIKGISYALFPASAGSYVASYGVDDTPPAITNITATPNLDGTATITWNTNEPATSRVDYALTGAPLDQNESASAYVTDHSIILSGLTLGATYDFRVNGMDAAGNNAESPTPPGVLSFTMPDPPVLPCVQDAAAEDFALGTLSGTYLAADENKVILAPAVASEFETLPSSEWQSFPWTGGTSTVAGGVLTVDGARFNTNTSLTFGPGSAIECAATFGATGFQHIGFGGGTDATGSGGIYNGEAPWAMFSTFNTTNTLYARVFDGATNFDTPIPQSLIGSSHRYRIEWLDGAFNFFVDGVQVHSQPATVAGTMRPAISDFNNGGPVVQVEWIRVAPYAASGDFTSRIFDAGETVVWGTANWTAETPAGSGIQLLYRQGNTAVPDGSWTGFTPIPSNGAVLGATSRYIQYRADFSTTDPLITPALASFSIECSPSAEEAPQVTGHPESLAVCDGGNATFSATATGVPAPGIQWQISTNGGNTWTDIDGATANPLVFAATLADNGNQYRAVFSNGIGTPAESTPATLTVNELPAAVIAAVNPALCPDDERQLQLDATGGSGPFDLVINGITYPGINDNQVFGVISSNPEQSIWPNTATPANPSVNDGQPIEIGVKFRSSVDGVINGIRFYKGVGNTGQHTGNLYTAGGALLASVIFTGETPEGWQEARFSTGVPVTANTTYVASYFSADGGFAITSGGLSAAVSNGSLTALASGTEGPNGVFQYGGGFPDGGSNANYWVDVLFQEPDQTTEYNLTSVTAANGCTLTGTPISQVTFTPAPVPTGVLAPVSPVWCPGTDPEATFTADPGTNGPYSLIINGETYAGVQSGVPFILNTPAQAPANIWSVTPTPSLIDDNEAIVLGVKFKSSTTGYITGIRFFKGWNDAGPLTYVVRLWSNGTQSSPGTILAEASASLGDAETGWQQVDFQNPVFIQANTVYIASFLTPEGNYVATGNYFQNAYNESGSPLTALAGSDPDGPNGVYVYSQTPGANVGFPFPSYSFNNGNYWVDVAFTPVPLSFTLTEIADANCSNSGPNLGSVTLGLDTQAPAAICQDITVELVDGAATITAAQIDNGSNDNCGIASMSVAPNSFTTADVGPNTVTLTVTDAAGLTSTCTAIVTVQEPVVQTLTGTIAVPASCAGRTVTLRMYEPGTTNLVMTETIAINAAGEFSVSGIAPGTYDVFVKMNGYLQKGLAGQTINAGATNLSFGALLAGDIDNNNNINAIDLSAIIAAYNTVNGDAAYNPAADFDCSGTIGGVDLSALIINYNIQGDEPGNP